MHESSQFITLTYAPENYPKNGSVSPREMQLFLKRLRRLVEPVQLRYYLVGEYGDHTQRATIMCCCLVFVIGGAWKKLGRMDIFILARLT